MKNYNGQKFAVIIPSHGRYDRVYTHDTLRKNGYTGDIYIVCDDQDKQLDKYKEKYGDKVLVFAKADYEGKFDKMDNFKNLKCVVYARNAIYDLAKKVGIKYISVLDDDYTSLQYRVGKDYQYFAQTMKNADSVFAAYIEFLETSKIATICFAQGGDFIGGSENDSFAVKKIPKRKMMNLYFFDVDKPIEFKGTINEDLTSSVAEGIIGNIVMTCPLNTITQKETQSNAGGLTDIYLDFGTYTKSFYSVMYAPSAVKISAMGGSSKRIHHEVNWKFVAPKIIRESV
jgi:hypothetical protein